MRNRKLEVLEVSLPAEVLKEARRKKVNMKKIVDFMRKFAILEIVAHSSKLTRKEANLLDRRIKKRARKRFC